MDDSSSGSSLPTDQERRLQAFKTARELVQATYAVKNDRGYPRFSGNVTDVLREEIRVAKFLLGEED